MIIEDILFITRMKQREFVYVAGLSAPVHVVALTICLHTDVKSFI